MILGLEGQRDGLEQIALGRLCGIGQESLPKDAAYMRGLQDALSAAVDFGLRQIEEDGAGRAAIPEPVLAQARLAAEKEISVGIVLRRCLAAFSVFIDSLMEEADRCGMSRSEARDLRDAQTSGFDALLAEVSVEHEGESGWRSRNLEMRLVHRLRRLLDGELVGLDDLSYPFGGYNLAVVGRGAGVDQQLRRAAAMADRSLLTAKVGGEVIWGWLGGQDAFSRQEDQTICALVQTESSTVALGEPCMGLEGWRLSHRQARAALRVAESSAEPFVRYADVAVIASAQQDRLLALSLREIYLAPLAGERDGGAKLRATLRAYIDAGRNVSSAAAALGVSRRTVTKRIEAAEEMLGRPIAVASPALDTALRLHSLTS